MITGNEIECLNSGAWSFVRGLIDEGEKDYEKIKRVITAMDLNPDDCYYMDRPIIESAMPDIFEFSDLPKQSE